MDDDTPATAGERVHGAVGPFPEPTGLHTDMFRETIALAFEEALGEGLLERPIELVVREVVAQPFTDGFLVIETYREFVEKAKGSWRSAGRCRQTTRWPSCRRPGTVTTFGREDHRGYKGADYLVIRHAKGGTTELVGTAPVA